MKCSFKIGELAKRTGLSVQAIRYYEAEGLIASHGRTQKGYRHFNEATVKSIELIKYYKLLGFSLKEIRVLLTYEENPEKYCTKAQTLFREKTDAIQDTIRHLSEQLSTLEKKLLECEVCNDKSSCKILKNNNIAPICHKKS